MGAEVRVSPTGDVWTQWEGQVINGTLPLRRCLGMSDHSGVFLTEYAARDLPNAALKLVPLIPTLAESQLAHWAAAGALTHPNLLRLFETGRCQLGSQHYLYVVMEYAEQNLAHLLQHRPLSEIEAREMLPLTLDALTFLHDKGLVQGQLKPSNVLVVGNQLKLASDTIRPAGESTASIGTISLYNPPEARDGSGSTSADIWALGVTLCQALTTRLPSRSGERSDDLVLPPDLPVSFVSVIRRCLIRNPAIRPSVTYLRDWLARDAAGSGEEEVGAGDSAKGEVASREAAPDARNAAAVSARARDGAETRDAAAASARARDDAETRAAAAVSTRGHDIAETRERDAAGRRAAVAPPAPAPQPPPPVVTRPDTNSAARRAEPAAVPPPGRRSYAPIAVAAVVLVAVAWGAVRWFSGHSGATSSTGDATPPAASNAAPPPVTSEPPPATPPAVSPPPAAGKSRPATPPATAGERPPSAAPSRPNHAAPATGRSSASRDSADSASVVHEEIPTVPLRARQTIHGRVKVVVLVTVDSSGTVVSDSFNNPGPSRYFAHLASEAARKWKFTRGTSLSSRHWLVRFEFSREGTKGHATPSN